MAAGSADILSRRLQKELMEVMTVGEKGVSAFPEGENLTRWTATLEGPAGTPYEGDVYKLSLEFPPDYPYKSPVVRFTTPCFHPNVDQYGNICLDILKENWSALYTVRTILLSLRSLLNEPNNDSPLNAQAASLWCNPAKFAEKKRAFQEQQRSASTKT